MISDNGLVPGIADKRAWNGTLSWILYCLDVSFGQGAMLVQAQDAMRALPGQHVALGQEFVFPL